jgi:glycosyltransferase involved in cell wall biosynthesis
VKILLHSNSPRSKTGYGVQTALLATRLAADGHQVAVSCNHGQDDGIGEWTTPNGDKIRLYPRNYKDVTSFSILHGHANHFFEGDWQGGWIIPLIDLFMCRNPFLSDFNVAAWAPVDHATAPPAVIGFFEHLPAAKPIAMSLHGLDALRRAGLDPTFIPLAVDTATFTPTPFPEIGGKTVSARELYRLSDDAFVVGMVAMNKGNVFDRKGFSEAFHAFGAFHRDHPESVLFVHTDKGGFEGINLPLLAASAGIPQDAVVFSDQYAYAIGFTAQMMAAAYTAMDVLLAPSHGEGFCVPLIEAQACGTPVIASNATAQPELVGAGWLVEGQPTFDPSQECNAFTPYVIDILARLEDAYAADLVAMQAAAVDFAAQYDADVIYDKFWRPFIAALLPPVPVADKPLMGDVAVVVPVMKRPQNVKPLVDSFNATSDSRSTLYFVCDPDDEAEIEAVRAAGLEPLISDRGSTFAQKANYAYEHTTESWIFLCGDDVEFTPGWANAARELSDRYDVIGTNDAAEGEIRNRDVAAGRHADHWFTRRAYIDETGACLEGPGVFCPEAYFHWWTDKEVIELAKARGVFTPCLDSRVIHHHPGFDGDEQARHDDPVYMRAVEWTERDAVTFRRRVGLIEQQRIGRAS